ncbi:MAG: DUF192 domain-containing protein [Rhodospirillaceae bacterium]|nr:DUF192 domain-containing protein [Rhodospirillaceae bacterium]
MFRRRVLAWLIAALVSVPVGAQAQALKPHEPLNPAKAQSLPLTPLVIEIDGARHAFQVELADTDATRTIGLMHRTYLAPDRGMLFDFKRTRDVGMWMRNTFISLDMLFIDRDGRVIAVAERTKPHSEQSIGPNRPVLAVLELAAGTAARIGLKPGAMVRHAMFGTDPGAPLPPATAKQP